MDYFVPVPACACSGAAFTRDMDRITRLEKLMEEAAGRFPALEVIRHDMADQSAYDANLKLLASLLRRAGEEEFADRLAFSLRYVLPAVAVGGELVVFGRVPDIEEIAASLKREEGREAGDEA